MTARHYDKLFDGAPRCCIKTEKSMEDRTLRYRLADKHDPSERDIADMSAWIVANDFPHIDHPEE